MNVPGLKESLCLICLAVSAGMSETAMAQSNASLPVVVVDPADGVQTLIYDSFFLGPSSATRRLYSSQSNDDGATWTTPIALPLGASGRQPQFVTSFQSGPSLLELPSGGYLNFHHFGSASPSDIWRQSSADGLNWAQSAIVDLGWPGTGGTGAGSGFPSVVRDGSTSLTMLYQRFAADGADPAGLYLASSNDLGLTWSPVRTLVAGNVALNSRAMLAHRTGDGRFVAAYVVSPGLSDSRIMVKTSDNALDWSNAPVLEITGDNDSPALTVMSDGAFVLLYSTKDQGQGDIFLRRSLDGIAWGDALRLTNTPAQYDMTPFGVAGEFAEQIEVYWSRSNQLDGFGGQIVHAPAMVVLIDPIFVSGFDE